MNSNNTNLPQHLTNNTFDGVKYIISMDNVIANLTGFSAVLIAMGSKDTVKRYRIDLVVTNALEGEISILKQIISWPPDTYQYEITFIYPNKDVKTLIKGNWVITNRL